MNVFKEIREEIGTLLPLAIAALYLFGAVFTLISYAGGHLNG